MGRTAYWQAGGREYPGRALGDANRGRSWPSSVVSTRRGPLRRPPRAAGFSVSGVRLDGSSQERGAGLAGAGAGNSAAGFSDCCVVGTPGVPRGGATIASWHRGFSSRRPAGTAQASSGRSRPSARAGAARRAGLRPSPDRPQRPRRPRARGPRRGLRRERGGAATRRDARPLRPRGRAGRPRARGRAAAAHDRRRLPARHACARRRPPLRRRRLHDPPRRPRRTRGGRGHARRGAGVDDGRRDRRRRRARRGRGPERVAYATQTTLSVDETAEIVAVLRRRFPAIEGPDEGDICYATTNRQQAVKELAAEVDVVLVIGSKNSSNSNRLVETAQAAGVEAHLIEDESEIDERGSRASNRRADRGRVGARAPRAARLRLVPGARRRGAASRARPRGRVLPAAGRGPPDRSRRLERAATEGFVPFRGYRTWYRIVGEPRPARCRCSACTAGPARRRPTHERLERLADEGRQVVAYDQLGCGDSDRPDDDSLWTLELFVSEVQAVRDALGARPRPPARHLVGRDARPGVRAHPAGGARDARPLLHARERRPVGRGDRPAARRARAGRDGGGVQRRRTSAGSTRPPPEMEAVEGEAQPEGLRGDVGPERVDVHRPSRGLDDARAARARSGFRRWSSAAPTTCAPRRSRTSSSTASPAPRTVVLEHSAHTPVVEEPERYRAVVGDFLGRVEAKPLGAMSRGLTFGSPWSSGPPDLDRQRLRLDPVARASARSASACGSVTTIRSVSSSPRSLRRRSARGSGRTPGPPARARRRARGRARPRSAPSAAQPRSFSRSTSSSSGSELLARGPQPAVAELLEVACLERRLHLRQPRAEPRAEHAQVRLVAEADAAPRRRSSTSFTRSSSLISSRWRRAASEPYDRRPPQRLAQLDVLLGASLPAELDHLAELGDLGEQRGRRPRPRSGQPARCTESGAPSQAPATRFRQSSSARNGITGAITRSPWTSAYQSVLNAASSNE